MTKKFLDREELLKRLHEANEWVGRDIGERDMEKMCRHTEYFPSVQAYRNQFGSWRQALEQAGIVSPLSIKQKSMDDITREQILKCLLHVQSQADGVFDRNDIENSDIIGHTHIYEEFGSIHDAREAIGIPESLSPRAKQDLEMLSGNKYSEIELIRAIQAYIMEHGIEPQGTEFGTALPSLDTYRNHFGSADRAIAQAKADLDEWIERG